MSLEERFEERIEKEQYNILEWTGFKKSPMLALKAGIAMGYLMALNDVENNYPQGSED